MIGPNPRPQTDIAEKTNPFRAFIAPNQSDGITPRQPKRKPFSAATRTQECNLSPRADPKCARRLALSPSPQACRKYAARDCRGATQDRPNERRPHVAPTGAREAAMKENDLQYRNARLRRKIDWALKNRPELEAVVNNIALKEPTNASPEQVQANLQERAGAIIDAEPELDGYFED
jgi:hypothetical protein